MVLIRGTWYPSKHPGRDTLSSGKRGYARELERREQLKACGIDPDAIDLSKVDPKKACPDRGDTL